eukprot:TRINITY_DN1081_c1_g1_i6.p1 TRINITY_DN1081_c1_g1~~TRINITY_DN1081_c1_g1_i6.p1  ORF type:complete len:117 (-),score=15.00 TRINITY_DN1081_c1_g1_i6:355-663(-)
MGLLRCTGLSPLYLFFKDTCQCSVTLHGNEKKREKTAGVWEIAGFSSKRIKKKKKKKKQYQGCSNSFFSFFLIPSWAQPSELGDELFSHIFFLSGRMYFHLI